VSCLAHDIATVIGHQATKRRLYETLALHYPAELIYRALSEYKADGTNVKHPVRYFLAILHRLAHGQGMGWIKPCPEDCAYRKSTSPPPEEAR
jgi:hypothetical protein